MVQQYGPLVKNFPSLVKILSAINSSDTTETSVETTAGETNTEPKQQKENTTTKLKEQPPSELKQHEYTNSTADVQQISRAAGPKLYV
jgi:hypothetical protein